MSTVALVRRFALLATCVATSGILPVPSNAQSSAARDPRPSPVVRKVKADPGPISAKACAAFALGLEESFRLDDAGAIAGAIDVDQILERAQKGIPAADKPRRQFTETARASLVGEDGLVGQILGTVRAGGTFRFVRLREEGGPTRALFRLTRLDATSFDYVELTLAASKQGGTIATDVWVLSEGASVTQSLRHYFLAVAAETTRNLADKVNAADKPWVEHAAAIAAMNEAFENGSNRVALDLYARLPDAIAGDETVLLARLRAARSVSTEAFTAALSAARARRPDDPSTELHAFEAFELLRAHDDAVHCIESIAKTLGGDPFLDGLAGAVHLARGDHALARAACKKAVEREPGLEDAWWTLVAVSLETKAYEDTLACLKQMDATFEIDWRDLSRTAAYQPFLDSAFGARWRAHVSAKR